MGRYAICENSSQMGGVAADCMLARACGADAIGVQAHEIARVGIDEACRIVDEHGLAVSSYMALAQQLPAHDLGLLVQQAESTFADSARLGCPGVLCTAAPRSERSLREADRLVRAQLAELAPLAAEHGVRIMLEPLHPALHLMTYVHTYRHALDLVGDHPGTGIVVDTIHLWWDGRFLDDLAGSIGRVATVQVADMSREALEQRMYRRVQLGEGVIPLAELLPAIDELGYRGFYENEVIGTRPPETAVDFFTEGRRRIEDWLAAR